MKENLIAHSYALDENGPISHMFEYLVHIWWKCLRSIKMGGHISGGVPLGVSSLCLTLVDLAEVSPLIIQCCACLHYPVLCLPVYCNAP